MTSKLLQTDFHAMNRIEGSTISFMVNLSFTYLLSLSRVREVSNKPSGLSLSPLMSIRQSQSENITSDTADEKGVDNGT